MTDKLIPDAAVSAIQDSVKTETIEVDGEVFVTRPVYEPPAHRPKALALHTLTGIIDYLAHNIDDIPANTLAIHIESEREVSLLSAISERDKGRDVLLRAQAFDVKFMFGTFMDSEQFIIALQSLFVHDTEIERVLRVVGNIKEENVRQASDDGVTQTVTAKAGIARVTEVEVPNPVTLRPYRTFREIDQPPSPFVLRMRQGREGQMPTCALFEADGGQWRLEAIEDIKAYFAAKVKDVAIIA